MSIERIFHCDANGCTGSIRTALQRPAATAFVTVTEEWPGRRRTLHFCSWGCVLAHAAGLPPSEVFE